MWKRHVEFRVVMMKPNPQTLLGEFEHMKDKKKHFQSKLEQQICICNRKSMGSGFDCTSRWLCPFN